MLPEKSAPRYKILVVDDEQAIADTFVEILGHAGYNAKARYAAEAALTLAREWYPHVAIVDIILPLMNGLGLAAALEIYCPETRILFFSGERATLTLLEAASLERDHPMFEKPIHPSALLEALKHLLPTLEEPEAELPGLTEDELSHKS